MDRKFYIFLDIDGVMYDIAYLKSQLAQKLTGKISPIKVLKPESVEALNFLMSELNKTYNTKLVISSTWRVFMQKTVEALRANGVKFNNAPAKIENISPTLTRGEKIMHFLAENRFNAKTDDYLIIDDSWFDFLRFFPPKKIIKTDIKNNALSMQMVKAALDNLNINKTDEDMEK